MPSELTAARHDPLDEQGTARCSTLAKLPAASRFILRGQPAVIAAAGSAFGAGLPEQACRAAAAADRVALWLGPDEWLLLAPESEGAELGAALERAMAGAAHSLVDVSHRQVGIEVSGPHAEVILNAGCPLDLDPGTFPVGMCTRTILGKTEIVLWRTMPLCFRLEVSRSFAAYLWRLLVEASREFGPQPKRCGE